MLVTNYYRVSPYVVSPSFRSRFIVLLVEPRNWRLLLLNKGQSVRMCIIVSESLLKPSHVGGYSLDI